MDAQVSAALAPPMWPTWPRCFMNTKHTRCARPKSRPQTPDCSSKSAGVRMSLASKSATTRWATSGRTSSTALATVLSLRMAKRVSKRAARGGERQSFKAKHGGTGTSHSRTAPGTIRAISVNKVGLFSWRLRARRVVGSGTRRRGGAPAHRPSGGGPGYGFGPDREIPSSSQAGDAFV